MMDIVHVVWVDSRMSEKSWCSEDDARCWDVSDCWSVGFLLTSDEKRVVLAMCWGDANVNGVIAIPRACVKSIQSLVRGNDLPENKNSQIDWK